MSVEKVVRKSGVVWRVRWRDAKGDARAKVLGRKRDAEVFDAEIKRRRRTGELAAMDGGRETLDDYVAGTWARAHAAHLAPRTRASYSSTYDRHISPRLGGMELRKIDPEVVATFQGDLIAEGTGPHAIQKAMTLLGAILQRAAESKRILYNPQRAVRKAKLPKSPEVRPLAPSKVELLRSVCNQRDATIVSVLAYAGLRPGELRILCWRDIGERTLLVNAPKTNTRRTVRMLDALRDDLRAWRRAVPASPDALVFPPKNGETWTANGFEKWRQRCFVPALRAAGLAKARPCDLRHSFASLLLHEGRSVIYVARQLGHGAELTMRTYGHVIDELEEAPRISAENAICEARTLSLELTAEPSVASGRI